MKTLLSALAAFAVGALAMRAWLSRSASHDAPESHGTEAAKSESHEANHADTAKHAEGELKVPKATQETLGLKITAATEVSAAEEVDAFGRVLDAGPLLSLVAELQSASAAAALSEQEWKRTEGLFAQDRNASARMLEQAEAARKRDIAQVGSLRARMNTTWCPELLQLSDLSGLLQRLSSRQQVLVRLDIAVDRIPVVVPTSARVAAVGRDDASGSVTILGRAAAADPQFLGAGYLGILSNGTLPAGTALTGWVPSGKPKTNRTLVPDSAVVRSGETTAVFVQTGAELFQKRSVALLRSTDAGWLLESGLKAGEKVVTTGAQALLSAASKPADAD